MRASLPTCLSFLCLGVLVGLAVATNAGAQPVAEAPATCPPCPPCAQAAPLVSPAAQQAIEEAKAAIEAAKQGPTVKE